MLNRIFQRFLPVKLAFPIDLACRVEMAASIVLACYVALVRRTEPVCHIDPACCVKRAACPNLTHHIKPTSCIVVPRYGSACLSHPLTSPRKKANGPCPLPGLKHIVTQRIHVPILAYLPFAIGL